MPTIAHVVQAAPHYISYGAFLLAEQSAEVKHEWLDGVVYAMAGGSIEHARLAGKWIAALTFALGGRCQVYSSDAFLYVQDTKLSTYADASVTCGSIERHTVLDKNGKIIGEAITNPAIIVEVLSDSTEKYDRGEKFAHYMRLTSLQEYVLVNQHRREIEVYRRPEGRGHWLQESYVTGTFSLHGSELTVDSLYAP